MYLRCLFLVLIYYSTACGGTCQRENVYTHVMGSDLAKSSREKQNKQTNKQTNPLMNKTFSLNIFVACDHGLDINFIKCAGVLPKYNRKIHRLPIPLMVSFQRIIIFIITKNKNCGKVCWRQTNKVEIGIQLYIRLAKGVPEWLSSVWYFLTHQQQPMVMGELGSIKCGGQHPVSTFFDRNGNGCGVALKHTSIGIVVY
jgi:hypothetical protein